MNFSKLLGLVVRDRLILAVFDFDKSNHVDRPVVLSKGRFFVRPRSRELVEDSVLFGAPVYSKYAGV